MEVYGEELGSAAQTGVWTALKTHTLYTQMPGKFPRKVVITRKEQPLFKTKVGAWSSGP